MPNTITNLVPRIYEALDTVSREMVGFIPAVRRDSQAERAAKGQSVTFPVVPSMSADDISAAATGPDPSDQTIGDDSLTISKSRSVTFYWTGEEERGLSMRDQILRDQFAQSMRTLTNEIETDLAGLYINASRAYGTSGTTPFGTANELDDLSYIREILEANGAPLTDLHLVMDTKAGAKLGGFQSALFKVNEAGTSDLLRNGALGRVEGLMLHKSGQVAKHTPGTGASLQTAAAASIGDTTVALDTGTGTLVAGDVVVIADEGGNQYVVSTGDAADADLLTIQNPGFVASVADNKALTIANAYRANLAFDRNAMVLVTRAPAMPAGGDAADDVMEIQDPNSGLAFQIAMYRQRRRVAFEVGVAWGYKAVKPEHMALLLG